MNIWNCCNFFYISTMYNPDDVDSMPGIVVINILVKKSEKNLHSSKIILTFVSAIRKKVKQLNS